jgi:hypothetical protein
MIARNDAMRVFQDKYDFLNEILFTIVRNKIFSGGSFDKGKATPASGSFATATPTSAGEIKSQTSLTTFPVKKVLLKMSSKVVTRAATLTGGEATRIADAFALLLLSNVTSDAAVDEWILAFPALKDLDEEFSWFRPMIEGLAASLLAETPFGVKLRAYSGAALSMLDMASDSYIISDMFASGRLEMAAALLLMVLANIVWQLVFVWLQNRKVRRRNNGWMMLRECLYVVTFVKPGVEAHRIASGKEELPGAAVSPLAEMAYSKGTELFFEAAPGMVLQLTSLITSEKKTVAAMLSILISAGCAAMTATTLAYDVDISPEKRKVTPDMCGMIPDTGRGLAFILMFSVSFLQVAAKCMSVALLAVTNPTWLVYYLSGDMFIYFVQKIIRGDFMYYVPLPLAAAIPTSVITRIMVKTVTDFSGCVLFRNPNELGGAYYSFNLVSTFVCVPVATYLYQEYYVVGDLGDSSKVDGTMLWFISVTITVLWIILFTYLIFFVIVSEYRSTFWSNITAWKRAENIFVENEDDEKRALIFKRSVFLWSRIKEDVKAWTMDNWSTWDDDKPDWFTDKFVSSVPDEFIPARFLRKLGGERGERERRGSAVPSIRDSLRDSFKG